MSETLYDGNAREAHLRAESETWDTSCVEIADSNDIPRIDISDYLAGANTEGSFKTALDTIVEQLRYACTEAGFYYLLGHGVAKEQREGMFAATRAFHDLPASEKEALKMDRPDWPVGGVGYLPLHHRKLPSRKTGNANEAFIVKRQSGKMKIDIDTDNQWPAENTLPGFRNEVKAYAECMEKLALSLLPLYARVLKVDPDFFKKAFTSPMFRLRMTKYPPLKSHEADAFGIGPHVDTSFFTLLDQDMEGLIIYSEKRQRWIRAPFVEGALIVNTGEMLKAWTNDRFPSVKHYATHIVQISGNSTQPQPRYSIPFFFNADADFRMHCIPTCCSTDETPKYPPFSYSESQALAQGE